MDRVRGSRRTLGRPSDGSILRVSDLISSFTQLRRVSPLPASREREREGTLQTMKSSVSRVWCWIKEQQTTTKGTKRLQVSETVSLGEKRFVAVVEVDGQHFLIGGGPSSVSMLAQLGRVDKFGVVLAETMDAAGNATARWRDGQS
jgi:Flagellar biosynthesis protein, FliO